METADILFDVLSGPYGDLGIVTLNRPRALNALNHAMILALHQQLLSWELNPQIKAVVVRAVEGRAFCAGGDIRHVYEIAQQDVPAASQFFFDEYRMNHCIYHYSKPYIALLDGITMGGGVGISIHGSHRVGSEHLSFAMPETGIGFFPDVGGSYFLPRLKDALGAYCGLLGVRLNAADCHYAGLIDAHVRADQFDALVEALQNNNFDDHCVDDIIQQFATKPVESQLVQQQEQITAVFSQTDILAMVEQLNHDTSEWSVNVLTTLQTKSPTSLAVTLAALQRGAQLNFDRCMQMEYRIARHHLSQHDFLEGVRALLIDKDQQAKWQPALLSDITAADIDAYFAGDPKDDLQFESKAA